MEFASSSTARKLSALLLSTLIAGCQSTGPSMGSDSEKAEPAGEDELLQSEQAYVPAGDDELQQAVERGSDGESDDTTNLDDSIEPSLKAKARKARERLDEGETAGNAEETAQKPKVVKEKQDLWGRLREQFAMDLDTDNKRIQQQLSWYARHPRYIHRVAKRAKRYLYYIVNQVEDRGLPGEYALLPVVESAFDPFAYSHGRAAGLWQFIPSTGHVYGLNQSWWHDQRRDVISATDGALKYLDALGKRFDGDPMLALASYNSGGGTVSSAIRKNRKRGKPTDYWSLHLPSETQAYVPKLIAISKIINDPDAYGVTLPEMPDKPYFDVVDTGSQIDLTQAAKLADIDVEEIYLLNPAYNRWATSPKGPHRLLIPVGSADAFSKNLANLDPKKRVSWENYRVRAGDSLSRIAHKFGTTPSVIKQINHMRSNLIRVDQRLLIPTSTQASDSYVLSANSRLTSRQQAAGKRNGGTKHQYTVRSGDSFWNISRKYQVSVRELAKWNGMAPGDPLHPGQKLVVWSKNNGGAKQKYTVRSGDTFWEIARDHHVGVKELARWNGMTSSEPLHPGQKLVIKSEKPSSKTLLLASSRGNSDMVRKVGYRVRQGDSLSVIANRFNVSVNDIAGWNSLNTGNYLQPGQSLIVYVDIRRSP